MTFKSNAFTTEELFSDLAQHVLNSRKQDGITDSTLGIKESVDISKIKNSDNLGDFVNNLNVNDTITKGGRVYEGYQAQHNDYVTKRFNTISSNSMFSSVLTDDNKLGYNFNMNDISKPKLDMLFNKDSMKLQNRKKAITEDEAKKLFEFDIKEKEDALDAINPSLSERQRLGLLNVMYNDKSFSMSDKLNSSIQNGSNSEIISELLNTEDLSENKKMLYLRSALMIKGLD